MPAWLFVIFIFIVVLGTVNGVNFTDGLDGLASGVTVIVATFFAIAALGINANMVTDHYIGDWCPVRLFDV